MKMWSNCKPFTKLDSVGENAIQYTLRTVKDLNIN